MEEHLNSREPRRNQLARLTANHKGTRTGIRQDNLRLALQLIYRQAPTSRAAIARSTKLTPATASALVDELIARDLVRELGPGESSGGKRPTLLGPHPEGRSVAALDLSAQPFRGALFDLRGDLLFDRSSTGTGLTGSDAIEAARSLITELVADAPAPVLGVGIGTPGVVDVTRGVVSSANLGWDEVALAELAAPEETPTYLVNDAQAAVLAEYTRGEIQPSNLVLVRIGEGVGAGIVLDGHLFRGDIAAAGEIGHLRVIDDGVSCRCGNTGCLETVAGMSALSPIDDTSVSTRFETAALHLGSVLAHMVAILAVRHLVLSGPIEAAGEDFRRRVADHLATRVLPLEAPLVELRYSTLGEDIVLLGAAGLVLTEELGVVW